MNTFTINEDQVKEFLHVLLRILVVLIVIPTLIALFLESQGASEAQVNKSFILSLQIVSVVVASVGMFIYFVYKKLT